MLKLTGKIVELRNVTEHSSGHVLKVTADPDIPLSERNKAAYLLSTETVPPGFNAYLVFEDQASFTLLEPSTVPVAILSADYRYLASGDVIRLSPNSKRLKVLYRRNSKHNNFLVTERCDNYCLMCSQPPKNINDDWIINEILEAIPLIDRATEDLGFTGGEPTIIGERLFEILEACKEYLPRTGIHVLSNGRRFSDFKFAKHWADVEHPDLMVGIPIYANVSSVHDYVVQADGAFDETIRGILNLKELDQRVELRVVLHRQTYKHLPRLAEFISRNLLFVDHVALMGLEIMGFTRANLDALWIDPANYQSELYDAVTTLDSSGLSVSIYNHQLCVLDERLRGFAVRSISDWKNEYLPVCKTCCLRTKCGGFFSSAVKYRHSDHIRAVSLT